MATELKNKPRGFYKDKSYLKWSKDEQTGYFNSFESLILWPVFKVSVLIAVYALWTHGIGCWTMGVISVVYMTMAYPSWVAKVVPNTIVMPIMDTVTLVSNDQAKVQMMNQSQYDIDDPKAIEHIFVENMIKKNPRF